MDSKLLKKNNINKEIIKKLKQIYNIKEETIIPNNIYYTPTPYNSENEKSEKSESDDDECEEKIIEESIKLHEHENHICGKINEPSCCECKCSLCQYHKHVYGFYVK